MNPVDLRQRARRESSQKLSDAVEASGIDLPLQLVGALDGLAREIGDQRVTTERMILVLERLDQTQSRLELTTRELSEELAALRTSRVSNGHAATLAELATKGDT